MWSDIDVNFDKFLTWKSWGKKWLQWSV